MTAMITITMAATMMMMITTKATLIMKMGMKIAMGSEGKVDPMIAPMTEVKVHARADY